jgi:hypothetical protein
MRNSRLEFCEQIVSKCTRNAFRARRKAFVIRNLFGCGGRSAPFLDWQSWHANMDAFILPCEVRYKVIFDHGE